MRVFISKFAVNQSMFVETKYNPVISRAIQPVRFIGLISLFVWFQKPDMSWDPSVMFFYIFIPLYLASFFVEVILTSPLKGLRRGFTSLSIKFLQLLPVEFAGIASFAMLSFAPHTSYNSWLAIEVSIVISVCWLGIEGYHKYIVSRLNRINLTPRQSTLTTIAFTIALFFSALYFFSLSGHHF